MDLKIILVIGLITVILIAVYLQQEGDKSKPPDIGLRGVFFQGPTDPTVSRVDFRACNGSIYFVDVYYLKKLNETSYIPTEYENRDLVINDLLGKGTFEIFKPTIGKGQVVSHAYEKPGSFESDRVIKDFERIILISEVLCISDEPFIE